MFRVSSLKNVSYREIAEVFNSSFSDYLVPIVFTQEQFEDKFMSEGGRLDLSVGVFKDEKLVSFILSFINIVNEKKISYNGGTGVVPEHRGNRLTSKMYEYLVPMLNSIHVDSMILEVVVENTTALNIYKSQGYEVLREVSCYKGHLRCEARESLKEGYQIRKIETLDWDRLHTFWDYPPTWQNSISTMKKLQKQNLSLGVFKDDTLLGYLIFNPKIKRVHQMAVHKNYRKRGLGNHLLAHLSTIEDQEISFINLDTRMTEFKSFLNKRGLKSTFDQIEMICQLTKNNR